MRNIAYMLNQRCPSSVLRAIRKSLAGKCLLAALLAAAGATGGCTRKEPLGQLMVTIVTDAPLPDYIDGIRLQAFHEYGDKKSDLIFDKEPEVRVGFGELLIPTTLAIVTNGRADDRVRLVLLARKFGQPRVLREAVTQVPPDRVVELRLAIEWLCDGSALPGDPMFCSDPEYTCAGGRCIPKWVDPRTLPNYVGPTSAIPGSAACFDVPLCFAQSFAVPLTAAGCSIPVPAEGLASFNVGLVVKPETGGQCIIGGNCLISLSRGPLGWDIASDGSRIVLPPAVCTSKASLITAIVASSTCPSKRPGEAICGAWSPFGSGGRTDAGAGTDAGPDPSMCERDDQCASGFCAQGRCCDSACAGPCRSCAVPGQEGICTTLVQGTVDPSGLCAAAAPETCGFDGTCDGAGGCRYWAAGTGCGSSSCYAPARLETSACNGAGACQAQTRDCSPYRCGPGVCALACDVSAQCAPGFYCNNKACVPQLPAGQGCNEAAACQSGFCADGLCCNTACDATCESCLLAGNEGKCTAVPFGDYGANDCAGANSVCNGARACVVAPVANLSFDNDVDSQVFSRSPGIGTGSVRMGTALESPLAANPNRIEGQRGSSLRLLGNQHVRFPNSAPLQSIATANAFTAAAWVRIASIKDGDAWVITRATPAGTQNVFGLGLRNGLPMGNALALFCPSSQTVPLNTWTHIATTYASNIMRLYVNGERQLDCAQPVGALNSEAAVYLGAAAKSGQLTEFWWGDLDEVFLLDRALSAAEIKLLMRDP